MEMGATALGFERIVPELFRIGKALDVFSIFRYNFPINPSNTSFYRT